jgi:hypothetical protein
LKATHIDRLYNAGKSSDKKDQRYLASINSIYDMVAALPDSYTEQDSDRFEHAHDVIKATGVRTKQLYAAPTQDDATRLLMEALKKRE